MIPVARAAGLVSAVSDEDLADAVERVLADLHPLRVERTASRYSTSAPIEEIVVQLADGAAPRLVLKDLTAASRLPGAKAGKPAFLSDPAREPAVYRWLLREVPDERSAACLHIHEGPVTSWLLLERVPGVELYQVGELAVWASAAAEMATMHQELWRALRHAPQAGARLLTHDEAALAAWLQRARTFDALRGGRHYQELAGLQRLHADVVPRLARLPPVVLHGDLYASNVLVVDGPRLRVCPIDWEYAGLGPAALDVAALTSGGWSPDERSAMSRAYWERMEDPRWQPDWEAWEHCLDMARLQVCVQWLGWFGPGPRVAEVAECHVCGRVDSGHARQRPARRLV
jgi:hypothetical protein